MLDTPGAFLYICTESWLWYDRQGYFTLVINSNFVIYEFGWIRLNWVELGWIGLNWVELGWIGFGEKKKIIWNFFGGFNLIFIFLGGSLTTFFLHKSFSYGQIRLHLEFHCPRPSGSALKAPGGWWWRIPIIIITLHLVELSWIESWSII